jgi:hypothetical protein
VGILATGPPSQLWKRLPEELRRELIQVLALAIARQLLPSHGKEGSDDTD